MKVFVARQPIFNQKESVCAYELLYRSNEEQNVFENNNPDEATIEVLINSLINIGINQISDNHLSFINFTENLLLQRLPLLLPAKQIVVEILEDVRPTPAVIEACRELKRKGYILALDDFVLKDQSHPLLHFADIVKIDFLLTTPEERKELVQTLSKHSIQLLAEKVETREQFEEAKSLGYTYFQGYFFSKPVIMKGQVVPKGGLLSYNDLYMELNQEEPNVKKIAQLIEQDVSFSYKILKLVNSPSYFTRHKVGSIEKAVVILGIDEIKKMVYLLSLQADQSDSNHEIFQFSLMRGKLCERLAQLNRNFFEPSECFLIGLFSYIDVILGVSLEEALDELALKDSIKDTLLQKNNQQEQYLLQMAKHLERGEWEMVEQHLSFLNVTKDDVYQLYLETIEWVNEINSFLT